MLCLSCWLSPEQSVVRPFSASAEVGWGSGYKHHPKSRLSKNVDNCSYFILGYAHLWAVLNHLWQQLGDGMALEGRALGCQWWISKMVIIDPMVCFVTWSVAPAGATWSGESELWVISLFLKLALTKMSWKPFSFLPLNITWFLGIVKQLCFSQLLHFSHKRGRWNTAWMKDATDYWVL